MCVFHNYDEPEELKKYKTKYFTIHSRRQSILQIVILTKARYDTVGSTYFSTYTDTTKCRKDLTSYTSDIDG